MTKSTTVLLLILIVSRTNVFSQQLSHQVMVPAGGIVTTSAVHYSQTIGETAVEIMNGGDYVLTQGFNQPPMSVQEKFDIEEINVYPNPARDFVNVDLAALDSKKYTIDFITISGTIVLTETIKFTTVHSYTLQINIENLKRGFYIVRVSSSDGIINRPFKIEKM